MQKTWVQSLNWEDAPEKAMATHSSILAWRIPWTEEPGRLQFMGHKELDTTEQISLTHSMYLEVRFSPFHKTCYFLVAERLKQSGYSMLIPNYYCKDYILCQCGHWSLFLSLCSASVLIEISLNAGNLQVSANWHWSSTCQACTVPKDQPKKKLRVFSGVFWACVLSWAHTWFSKFPHLQSCFYFLKCLKNIYFYLFGCAGS